MLRKIEEYCKQNHMIKKGDRIVIGLSGGADSVCLFCVLLSWQERYELALQAVHIHHKIRGQEADRDAEFVENLCRQYHVPVRVEQYDVPQYAKQEGISEEEAGRKIRYAAFERLRQELGYNRIAVAHHMGDQAETILFHLCRGSGLGGMVGMRPVSGTIIRPLLQTSRKEIEGYLEKRGQSWCTDSTNAQSDYMRNRLRNEVIPMLEQKINAETTAHIAWTGTILGEVYAYINREAEKKRQELVTGEAGRQEIPLAPLQKLDSVIRKELFRVLLEESGGLRDVTANHIDMLEHLTEGQVGSRTDLPGGRMALRTYESILFFDKQCTGKYKIYEKDIQLMRRCADKLSIVLIPGESYPLSGGGSQITLSVPCKLETFLAREGLTRDKIIAENPYTKCFDYDRINGTLELRTRREGDVFGLGAGLGTQKLKKYFIDKKIPKEKRNQILLVAEGNHILWIIGYRISSEYKVTEDTKNILQIKLSGGQ